MTAFHKVSATCWRWTVLFTLTACGGGASTDPVQTEQLPPGVDTSSPFPIDRGDEGPATPGSYKGLPLRLVDNGSPAITPVDGIIGVVCIGMSNGNRECTDFQARVVGEYASQVNLAVRVVNCAVGGNAIEEWINAASDNMLWDACINQRLPAAGVRLDQVRVIWHKAANQYGNSVPAYPAQGSDYFAFMQHLSAFAARVRGKFPSVQAVYTSSRSYGGYSTNNARNEPLSYEEGHALNQWLATHATVDGVWYGWGAYLWAPACSSGVTNASGVCYDRADFVEDAVHPSSLGQAKISAMLHARFSRDSWWRR